MSKEHESTSLLIGPGLPDEPCCRTDGCSSGSHLIDDARRQMAEADARDNPGAALLRRLVVAFVLVAVVAAVSYVVLPSRGIHLPPMLPLLGFLVILVGTLLGSAGDQRPPARPRVEDDGRPICCSGPRPLRAFRDQPTRD